MDSCEQYGPYLAGLADNEPGAIPAEVREPLRAHVQACRACQAELARQGRMDALFAAAAPPAVSEARWQRIWDLVDAQSQDRTIRLAGASRRWWGWMAAAASVAAAAIVVLAVLLWPAARPTDALAAGTYAFATENDSDIEMVETYGEETTPVIITAGGQDVLVVWMLQEQEKIG